MMIEFLLLTDLLATPQSLLAQSLGGLGGGDAQTPTGSVGGSTTPLLLVSPYKPVLALIAFAGWAWVVATIFDKDAARWYLNRKGWNLIHTAFAVAALAAVLLIPIFWIGWPVMILLLGADLGVYAFMRNRDEKVPVSQKWSFDFEKMRKAKASRQSAKLQRAVSLELRGPSGVVPAPSRESSEYEVRVGAEKVLIDALESRATRFDIAPGADDGKYGVAFLVDGVRQMHSQATPQQAAAVIDFLKAASGLDVEDRRRKQRADLGVEQAGGRRTLRITTSGSSGGVRLSGLFDPSDQVRMELNELGLLDKQREELDAIVNERQGAVLVAAPPISGRTTTLYTLLRTHDAYTSNVQIIEVEQQDQIEGVRHNIFDPMKDGAEYSTTVRSILRRDPDVVAIAELPDANTAQEVTRADHERTRTYVGLRAESALAAIQTFIKAVGDPKAASSCLHGVIAQRLIRKLCLNCRVEYPPSPELLKKLGVPEDKVSRLFKRGGQVLIKNKPEVCPVCKGGGYFGQEGIFEIFQLGAEERQHIANADLAGLRSALRKKRLPSIQEAALHKAVMGVTSLEEVARVTGGGGAGAQKGGAAKQPAA